MKKLKLLNLSWYGAYVITIIGSVISVLAYRNISKNSFLDINNLSNIYIYWLGIACLSGILMTIHLVFKNYKIQRRNEDLKGDKSYETQVPRLPSDVTQKILTAVAFTAPALTSLILLKTELALLMLLIWPMILLLGLLFGFLLGIFITVFILAVSSIKKNVLIVFDSNVASQVRVHALSKAICTLGIVLIIGTMIFAQTTLVQSGHGGIYRARATASTAILGLIWPNFALNSGRVNVLAAETLKTLSILFWIGIIMFVQNFLIRSFLPSTKTPEDKKRHKS
ncbi:MAG: hypothetical protein H6799_02850 [Candidatus Nomurabacteria bacterium]|nr:MAG: hypothetical protein H6799_02850 [Candidatus Nomurabacteria bacterium]HRV76444.1 hypothetical protein [Candidatus Saccharimonadales bacterium]